MTRLLVPTLVALCALAAGCGGSTDSDGSSTGGSGGSAGGGGSGGSSGGGAGGSGGTCESFVPCCDSQGNPVTPICPTPGKPECPAGSSWPPNGTCAPSSGACSPSKPCAADEYCDYGDDLCGAGSPGKCTKRPQGCDLLYAPVCTCEGKVAGNECSGQSGGWDVSAKGGCTPPQDLFACGHLFCTACLERALAPSGGGQSRCPLCRTVVSESAEPQPVPSIDRIIRAQEVTCPLCTPAALARAEVRGAAARDRKSVV